MYPSPRLPPTRTLRLLGASFVGGVTCPGVTSVSCFLFWGPPAESFAMTYLHAASPCRHESLAHATLLYKPMPPIPIYTDAPITPTKADGVTPKTAEPPTRTTDNVATTNDGPAYPAAQPAAAAFPGPTPAISRPQPSATRTIASQDTPYDGPPPPQPGAVPMPPSHPLPSSTSIPPPPQPGATAAQPAITAMPAQASIPPPSSNAAPTHSTYTSPPSSAPRAGPTTLNLGPVNPPAPSQASQYSVNANAHPPGYVQNEYAQEMTPAQRASLEVQEVREAQERRGRSGSLGGSLGGMLGAGGADEGLPRTEQEAGVWGSVKGWAGQLGEKAVRLEKEVWKRIDGE
ncbi:hypothetical protein M8818_003179 [Zalaria obscura]|uniref:Uncharacterized protein n=1 Tax=Zalaria obscura TaxID=2024903 RepID=A0ACC3SFT9_9PEZI